MHCYSKVLSVTFGLSLLLLGGCQTTRKMTDRATGWMPWVHRSEAAEGAASGKTVRTHGLAFTLRLAPVPVKLSATSRVEATLRLENVSSRFIQLEFASAQRFDVLVRDAAGRVVVQWSEDRVFDSALGYVGINPGEHLEYQAAFSTRDLQPGRACVVTALVTGRDDLKVELPLVPEK